MLIPNKVSGYYDLTTKKYLAKIFDEKFAKLYTIVTILLKIVKSETEPYSEFNRLNYHICYLIYRFANKVEDINSIESYFKDDKTLENQTELEQNELINTIYSNVYNVLKEEKAFKTVLEYVVNVIRTKYSALLDTSDKKKERILYDPVQKLKGVKGNKKAVFENFDADFSENFKSLIDKLK
jgi:hypothetical protein